MSKRKPRPTKHPFFSQRQGRPVFLEDKPHAQVEAMPGATLLVPYVVNGKERSLFTLSEIFSN